MYRRAQVNVPTKVLVFTDSGASNLQIFEDYRVRRFGHIDSRDGEEMPDSEADY